LFHFSIVFSEYRINLFFSFAGAKLRSVYPLKNTTNTVYFNCGLFFRQREKRYTIARKVSINDDKIKLGFQADYDMAQKNSLQITTTCKLLSTYEKNYINHPQ
jgi:hypothetical protein